MPLVDLTEVAYSGIRRSDKPTGKPELTDLKGFACRPEGLVPIKYPDNPFPKSIKHNLFPQGDFSQNYSWDFNNIVWRRINNLARKETGNEGYLNHPLSLPPANYRLTCSVSFPSLSQDQYLKITIGDYSTVEIKPTTALSFNYTSYFTLQSWSERISIFGTNSPMTIDNIQIYEMFSYDFPFPNLFVGDYVKLLGRRNELLSTNDLWGSYEFEIYDADNPASLFQVTEGGIWEFCEFGYNWIANNGETIVWRHNNLNYPFVLGRNNRKINSICYHRGRVLMGGFHDNPNDESMYYNGNSDIYGAKDKRAVCWSDFAAIDAFEHLMNGYLDEDQKQSILRANSSGFLLLPMSGEIMRLLPLGEGVVAYTTEGTFFLPFIRESFMYGVQMISASSIYSRESVGGDENVHVYIDSTGRLHRVTTEGDSIVGYLEVFEPLVEDGKTICISFDSYRGDFYITHDSESLILTQNGLSKSNNMILTVNRYRDRSVAVFDPIMDMSGYIEFAPMSFGIRGTKTVSYVSLRSDSISPYPVVTVSGRMNRSEDWRSIVKGVDAQGIAVTPMSGEEIKLSIDFNNNTNCQIFSLEMSVSNERKRF